MILLGTCSWNYDSWLGLVYSEKRRTAAEYLAEYARKYRTAEVDSWFYKIPTKADASSYALCTPDDFVFTCKVSQDITLTHARERDGSGAMIENDSFLSVGMFDAYCEGIEPLSGKIGLLMFEFEYLNREKVESPRKFMDLFAEFKAKTGTRYKIGIEIRNKNFLTEEYFRFLRDNDIVHVFSEKLYMPHVYEVYARFKDYIGSTAAFRLLGNDRKEIEEKTGQNWNAIVDEKKDKEEILRLSLDAKFKNGNVILNVNNHYEGSAPLTIEAMRAFYRSRGIEI